MREAGLRSGPVATAEAYTREAGRAAACQLLDAPRRGDGSISAIVAANDLLALGAYQALAARGVRCPDDISITGHNDMPLVDMVQPPLTTARIDHDRIGREGAAILLDRLEHPGAPISQVLLPSQLVVRASTASALKGDIGLKKATPGTQDRTRRKTASSRSLQPSST